MCNIVVEKEKCILCRECIAACPFGAISNEKNKIIIQEMCRGCGICEKICPTGAISMHSPNYIVQDKQSWKHILVDIQYENEKVHPISYQLIGKAYELAQVVGYDVYGIVIGKNTQLVKKQLQGYPLKKVFLYETDADFRPDYYESIFSSCIKEVQPSVVLIGGTLQGRSFAPRLATTYRSGLTADCTELEMKSNTDLVQIRPAFGGNIMAQIVTPHTRPQFATVRYNVMKAINPTFKEEIVFVTNDVQSQNNKQIDIIDKITICSSKGIQEQEVLVVAGRGVKKKEDLAQLEEFAKALGGMLASTRALVEKGWMPSERQIGISGKTVNPKLLITCGVSGSIQFLAGIRNAETIIAVNTDEKAKIFEVAHYPVCGDLYEIIPILTSLWKERK